MDEVSMRELRNASDDVLARVERGASLTVTRDGEPVAELHPASGRRLSREALLSRWRALPAVDPTAFRADVSHLLDEVSVTGAAGCWKRAWCRSRC